MFTNIYIFNAYTTISTFHYDFLKVISVDTTNKLTIDTLFWSISTDFGGLVASLWRIEGVLALVYISSL
jgi:fluoride ion exporter CrcB/FEX